MHKMMQHDTINDRIKEIRNMDEFSVEGRVEGQNMIQ